MYHDVLIDSLKHIAMTDEIKVSAHICTRLLIAHFALNLVNSTYEDAKCWPACIEKALPWCSPECFQAYSAYEVYSLNAHTIIAWCWLWLTVVALTWMLDAHIIKYLCVQASFLMVKCFHCSCNTFSDRHIAVLYVFVTWVQKYRSSMQTNRGRSMYEWQRSFQWVIYWIWASRCFKFWHLYLYSLCILVFVEIHSKTPTNSGYGQASGFKSWPFQPVRGRRNQVRFKFFNHYRFVNIGPICGSSPFSPMLSELKVLETIHRHHHPQHPHPHFHHFC